MTDKNDVVIGLEVHVQLKTNTKLFCSCKNEFAGNPNEHTCPVCMGLPGVLPVINETAVEYAIKAARALNCDISSESKFDRKNYYYPDLPKAYQISQYDMPIATDGELEVEWGGGSGVVPIERVHLEEDAGKLIHARNGDKSYVDYNRAGTPLIEIVTTPDITEPAQAHSYLKTLKKRMEFIGVSDCNMEEGSLRCDANLSIRQPDGGLGVKTEVKNMNSFQAVRSALEHERDRQRQKLDRGSEIQQGTRLWDEDSKQTKPMRTKEEEHDYRYFPEPDLVPLEISEETVDRIDDQLPEMPDIRAQRFMDDLGVSDEESSILTETKQMADFFEQSLSTTNGNVTTKQIVNLIKSDLRRELNELNCDVNEIELTPSNLGTIARLLDEDEISSNVASELIEEIAREGGDPEEIIDERDMRQISDEGKLDSVITEVIDENPDAVEDIKDGKEEAVGFLVGQVMQKTQGQANPEQANEMIRDEILD